MPETDMTDVAIGVMVGGAAGFALGRWSEKSNGKKQKDKLKALIKKGDKKEKKDKYSHPSEKHRHHRHSRTYEHHHQYHGYSPYQSMPVHHHHGTAHTKPPGYVTETTTVHAWNRPHQDLSQQYLPPPNHMPSAPAWPQAHETLPAHARARSASPPMRYAAQGAHEHGHSRYY